MEFFREETVVAKKQITDFVNNDLREFSTYDCIINLPNLVDGFKISQRKAVWGIHKENKQTTVERYASKIADMSAYHHGATNLEGVIVGLAQNFPCSNNVNWVEPDGQFGNILDHSSSSARYISAGPCDNFRKWFPKDDDLILEYQKEDGETIEPVYFIPKVPTILFNGSNGIGTGYACTILQYNPDDVIKNVKKVLTGKKQDKLIPWYRGYRGLVSKTEGQTVFTGVFERINSTKIRITELPIGYSQEKYLTVLSKLIENGTIKDFDDDSTSEGWDITIYATREFVAQPDSVLIDKLQLVTRDSENIVVWDEKGKIKRFACPEDLLVYFVGVRTVFYEKRRLALIESIGTDVAWNRVKARFIAFYLDNVQTFSGTPKAELIQILKDNNFDEYDRLLAQSIWSLTKEKIDQLNESISNGLKEIERLKNTTASEMYLEDL
jgi:DNA topoisomerase-2